MGTPFDASLTFRQIVDGFNLDNLAVSRLRALVATREVAPFSGGGKRGRKTVFTGRTAFAALVGCSLSKAGLSTLSVVAAVRHVLTLDVQAELAAGRRLLLVRGETVWTATDGGAVLGGLEPLVAVDIGLCLDHWRAGLARLAALKPHRKATPRRKATVA